MVISCSPTRMFCVVAGLLLLYYSILTVSSSLHVCCRTVSNTPDHYIDVHCQVRHIVNTVLVLLNVCMTIKSFLYLLSTVFSHFKPLFTSFISIYVFLPFLLFSSQHSHKRQKQAKGHVNSLTQKRSS